jgi:hypothetical protein
MNIRIKRHPAVWLTQSLLIIFALLFLSVFLLNLVQLFSHPGEGFSVFRTVTGFPISLGIVFLCLSSFWGRTWPWTRGALACSLTQLLSRELQVIAAFGNL